MRHYSLLDRLTEWLWLLAAIAIPLVFNPSGLSPFALPKACVLQGIALVMLFVVFVSSVQKGARLYLLNRRGTWAALGFLLAVVLSTATSANPLLSFRGTLDRQQGLLSWASYLFLFLVISARAREKNRIERLLNSLVIGSALPVLYGLVQFAGWDPINWDTNAPSKVLSSFGRSNFFGSYLVIVFPLTLARFVSFSATTSHKRALKAVLFVLLFAQVFCIAVTLARGAWLGLLAAVTIFAVAHLPRVTRRTRIRTAQWGVGMLIVLVILLLATGQLAGQMERDASIANRIATIVDLDEGATAARLTIWQFTLPLIGEKPLLGYGPEMFYRAFVPIFPPQLVYYQGRHTEVDRAHNLILDLLVTAGAMGLIPYCLLVLFSITACLHAFRWNEEKAEQIMALGVFAAIGAHLVDQQFTFSLVGTQCIFWFILALGNAMGASNYAQVSSENSTRNTNPAPIAVVSGAGIFCILFIALFCIRPLIADVLCNQARSPELSFSIRQAKAARAVSLQPLEPAYREQMSWIQLQQGNYEEAKRQMERAETLLPNDPRVFAAKGHLYALWAKQDPGRYSDAVDAYRRAIELAPHIATYYTALGLILAESGQLEKGIRAIERAVDLDATDAVAYGYLARFYQDAGLEGKAREAQKLAEYWREKGGSPAQNARN